MRFAAFQAVYSDVDGRWLGAGYCDERGTRTCITRGDLIAACYESAAKDRVLLCQDAERQIVDVFWPGGEDVTIHSYEQIFNRAVWRYGKGRKVEIWDSRNLAAGLSIEAIGKGIRLPLWDKPSRQVYGTPESRYKWTCDKHGEWECEPCYRERQAEILYRFASALSTWME